MPILKRAHVLRGELYTMVKMLIVKKALGTYEVLESDLFIFKRDHNSFLT